MQDGPTQPPADGQPPAPHDPVPVPAPAPAPVADPVVPRTWIVPVPYGRAAAAETMTGVAAPLLAGFSLTLIGVVAQAPTSFRWPGAALAALCAVVCLLILCVQIGFRARSFMYSKADVAAWLPEPRDQQFEDAFAEQQRAHAARWRQLHGIARFTYNAAIVMLAGALALVIAPPGAYPAGTIITHVEQQVRWCAAALAVLGGLGELIWIFCDFRSEKKRRNA